MAKRTSYGWNAFVIVGSIVWGVVLIAALWHGGGLEGLFNKESRLGPAGDFIAGFMSPLVFIWLLFGYAMQRRQLEVQQDQIDSQAKELHRDRTLRVMVDTWPQLHELAHVIHHRWMSDVGYVIDPDASAYDSLKRQYDGGDKAIFCRELNDRLANLYRNDYAQLLYDRASAAPELEIWLNQFVELFDLVRGSAQAADLDRHVSLTPHVTHTAHCLRTALADLQQIRFPPSKPPVPGVVSP